MNVAMIRINDLVVSLHQSFVMYSSYCSWFVALIAHAICGFINRDIKTTVGQCLYSSRACSMQITFFSEMQCRFY